MAPSATTARSFEEVKEWVKDRADLSAVVGRHTKLVKEKTGFKACCPLPGHKEKTPSFHVNTVDNYFYCYGCNRGGDIFTFLELVEGIPFFESLKELATQYGIELPQAKTNKDSGSKEQGSKSEKDAGFELLDRAVNYFQRVLVEGSTPGAQKAQEYLLERNIPKEEWIHFQLGWAPENGALAKKVKDKKSEYELAQKTGLVREYSGRAVDFFMDRLMIPIHDARGRPIAFSGRTLKPVEANNPKYKNSAESDWFKKKTVLYGLNRVLKLIREDNFVCFVEGYFDQWAFERVEVPAVAVMGTALTEEHLALLERHTKQAVLVMDADRAGIESTRKSLPLFLSRGWEVKVFSGLDGKDPDEWLKGSGFTKEKVKQQLLSAADALLWWALLILKECQEQNLNRIQTLNRLGDVWSMTNNEAHRTVLADELARHMGLRAEDLKLSLREFLPNQRQESYGANQNASYSAKENLYLNVKKKKYTKLEKAAEDAFILWLQNWDLLTPQTESDWQQRETYFRPTLLGPMVKKMASEHSMGRLGKIFIKQELEDSSLDPELRSLILRGLVGSVAEEGSSSEADKALKSFKELETILFQESVHLEISRLEGQLRAESRQNFEEKAQFLQRIQELRMSLEKAK